MILDRQNLFSNAQAIAAAAVSTDTIDLGAARDIGPGEPVTFSVLIQPSAVADATLTATLETSETSDFSVKKTLLASGAITGTQLKNGARYVSTVPHGAQRYLRVSYEGEGVVVTSGLNLDTAAHRNYASGWTVGG